jgi:hypothetical protein
MCAPTRPACSSLHRLRSNGVERDSWINKYDIAVHRAPLAAPPGCSSPALSPPLTAGCMLRRRRRRRTGLQTSPAAIVETTNVGLPASTTPDQDSFPMHVLPNAAPPAVHRTKLSFLLRCPRGRLGRVHPREPNIEQHWSQNSARRGVDLHCILNAPNVASYLRITGGPLRESE